MRRDSELRLSERNRAYHGFLQRLELLLIAIVARLTLSAATCASAAAAEAASAASFQPTGTVAIMLSARHRAEWRARLPPLSALRMGCGLKRRGAARASMAADHTDVELTQLLQSSCELTWPSTACRFHFSTLR